MVFPMLTSCNQTKAVEESETQAELWFKLWSSSSGSYPFKGFSYGANPPDTHLLLRPSDPPHNDH